MLEWDFAFNSTSADICIVPCALPFPTQSYRFCIFIITAIVTELQRICSSSDMTHMQMINPVHEVTSQQRKRRERKSGEKFGIMWAATARQNIWWDLKNPHGGEMKILVKPKSIYASILINKMFLLKYVWKKKAFFLLRLISGQELNSIFVIIFFIKTWWYLSLSYSEKCDILQWEMWHKGWKVELKSQCPRGAALWPAKNI